MHNFAPVLIMTLNRYNHFRRCVESLAECTHAEKTDLYIALDYPFYESHWDGYKKIANYVNEIKGFKRVVIIKRDKNFGVLKNYFEAREEIFKKYDRIIISEDDNEFSPNFLEYLNKGLNLFACNKKIHAICAYNYPIEDENISNVKGLKYFYAKTFSAWGFGIWRDRYRLRKNTYTPKETIEFLKSIKNLKEIWNMAPKKIKSMLISVYQKRELFGDSIVSLENIKNETICVFPVISKVRNHGHDGSGLHGGNIPNSIYKKQIIDKNTTFKFTGCPDVKFSKKYQRTIKSHFKIGFKDIIILPLLFIIILLNQKKIR